MSEELKEHEVSIDEATDYLFNKMPENEYEGVIFSMAISAMMREKESRAQPDNPPQWISVEDRLPGKSGTFIICTSYRDVFVAEYWLNREEFTRRDGSIFFNPIVYWQPLPEPPQKPEEGKKA